MEPSVDVLFITHNRRQYVEKTLPNLLCPGANINLYWWDNASTDGVAELQEAFDDPRVVLKHRSPQNVMQLEPARWFLSNCRSDVVGKVDDDTLVPPGWERRLASVVRAHDNAGMVGCWTFWPEDLERNRSKLRAKLCSLGSQQVIRNLEIGGTAFLMRRQLAQAFFDTEGPPTAFPIKRGELSHSGYCSGWVYPILWAEHMDDPRSEHYQSGKDGGIPLALSARVRGLETEGQYLAWIKQDADKVLNRPFARQLMRYRLRRSLLGDIYQRLARWLAA